MWKKIKNWWVKFKKDFMIGYNQGKTQGYLKSKTIYDKIKGSKK